MNTDLNEDNFILSTFLSKLDESTLSEEKISLIQSISNLHAAHLSLHLGSAHTLRDLLQIIIHILQTSIKEGFATKEEKVILEKLKKLASAHEEILLIDTKEYNHSSKNLIDSLKTLGIK